MGHKVAVAGFFISWADRHCFAPPVFSTSGSRGTRQSILSGTAKRALPKCPGINMAVLLDSASRNRQTQWMRFVMSRPGSQKSARRSTGRGPRRIGSVMACSDRGLFAAQWATARSAGTARFPALDFGMALPGTLQGSIGKPVTSSSHEYDSAGGFGQPNLQG